MSACWACPHARGLSERGSEARLGANEHLDTTSTVAVAVLIASTALLAVISAAEAAVGAISRGRLHGNGHGLSSLLDRYIHQRQQVLRALNAGGSLMMVASTVALVVLLLRPYDVSFGTIALAAGVALLLSTTVRQCARVIALVNPEATGLVLGTPITALQIVLGPVAWALSTPARALVRMAGRDPDATDADAAGELLAVLESGGDDQHDEDLTEERRMMRGILAMSEQTVREVMSPRIDLAAIATSATLEDAIRVVSETGFSRIPLFEESIDHIVGVVYAKDLLGYLRAGQALPRLAEIARPPYFVPESKRVDDLLSDMRRDQVHMAVVVDEYGGTAGVVTVEDLLEEIVGEIADEYDIPEEAEVERLSEDECIVDAGLSIDDLNDLFDLDIDSEDFDTVGGLVLALLGRLAVPGDEVISEDGRLTLRVLSILGRRIKKVRARRAVPEESAAK